MKNSKVYIIVAVEENFGIGKDGVMPWNFKCEMKHFKNITTKVNDGSKKNAVIMGRTTWLSLPEKHRPLIDRKNIIISKGNNDSIETKGCNVENSPEIAIEKLKDDNDVETIFIIGGASIYKYSIENIELDGIYITRIRKDYDCDTFFPQLPNENYKNASKIGEDEETGTKIEYFLCAK